MNYFESRYLTLVGYVQSGKTNEEMNYCYNSITHHKTPVLFIVRNIIADQLQLRDRFKSFKEINVKSINESNISMETPCVVILLCNESQLKKAKKLVIDKKYNLCIDEVDFSLKTKNESSTIDILLNELKQNANHILGATATPYALFSAEKTLTNIKKIQPSNNYHGIEKLKVNFIDSCIIKSEYDFPLCDMSAMDTIYSSLLEKDHSILLHTVVKEKKLHYNIMEYITSNFNEFTVITYNGDGIRISCVNRTSKIPLADTLTFNKYNQLINKYIFKDNIHYFKNYTIAEVLQILKEDPYYNHTHISMIAGQLASRGISFVSSDYNLHLTDQYFHAGKQTHGENLLQSLRILGCYNDNIPLTLWCSKVTWEAIIEQTAIVNKLVNELDNCRDWMVKIKQIQIPHSKRPLTRQKLI